MFTSPPCLLSHCQSLFFPSLTPLWKETAAYNPDTEQVGGKTEGYSECEGNSAIVRRCRMKLWPVSARQTQSLTGRNCPIFLASNPSRQSPFRDSLLLLLLLFEFAVCVVVCVLLVPSEVQAQAQQLHFL